MDVMSAIIDNELFPTRIIRHFDGAELRLFESGRLSDCQVSFGSTTLNLHKFIICDRSEYFGRALGGNFVEAAKNKVVINESDMSDDCFVWVVRWLYKGGPSIRVCDHAEGLWKSVMILIHADYLVIPALCKEVTDAVARHATEVKAKDPTASAHKNLPSDWVEAMRLFYKTFLGEEKHGMKSALFDLGLRNREFKEQIFKLEKLEELILDMPEFCQDLMLETIRRKL